MDRWLFAVHVLFRSSLGNKFYIIWHSFRDGATKKNKQRTFTREEEAEAELELELKLELEPETNGTGAVPLQMRTAALTYL